MLQPREKEIREQKPEKDNRNRIFIMMRVFKVFSSKRSPVLWLFCFIIISSLILIVAFESFLSVRHKPVESSENIKIEENSYERPLIVFTRVFALKKYSAGTTALSVVMKMMRRQFNHMSKLNYTEYFLDPNGESKDEMWSEQTFHDSIYSSSPVK